MNIEQHIHRFGHLYCVYIPTNVSLSMEETQNNTTVDVMIECYITKEDAKQRLEYLSKYYSIPYLNVEEETT